MYRRWVTEEWQSKKPNQQERLHLPEGKRLKTEQYDSLDCVDTPAMVMLNNGLKCRIWQEQVWVIPTCVFWDDEMHD